MLQSTDHVMHALWQDCHQFTHPRVFATMCGHEIHPSSPMRTPKCPNCILLLARSRLNQTQTRFIDEGGLTLPTQSRGRRWNLARIQYDIATKRLQAIRRSAQLRWEREQLWEDAHQYGGSLHEQTVARFVHTKGCFVCASLIAQCPMEMCPNERREDSTWWERSNGDLTGRMTEAGRCRILKRTVHNPIQESRSHTRNYSEALHMVLRKARGSTRALSARSNTEIIRSKAERVVRRKYSLAADFTFDPDFFTEPISGLLCLRTYQHVQENQRMAECRARGFSSRPKPPRSSLSQSQSSEDLVVDEAWLESMAQKEELEELEREARKVGTEVGYLYFIGAGDNVEQWEDDFWRSDRQLVVRKPVEGLLTSCSVDDFDEMDFDDL